MKKTAIASVALAAALFAVSCQKENTLIENVSGPMTISAVAEGLNSPTKTQMIFKYDVAWSANDKIYVKDASGNNDTFSLTGGAGTTKGTFKQDGDATFTGEVQAYYPATMLQSGSPLWPASQTNDQTIPMYCKKTLSGTTDERMDFASLGSVLQIVFNTTQAGVTLQSIEIKDGSKTMSGAFHVDENGMAVIDANDKAGITLDLGTGKALGKGANYFNIAVSAGDYQDLTLVFTATDGKKCTMTGGKVNIAYNAVGRLTLMGEKFKADVPDGALAGKFSVSNDGGTTINQVHFSQGNLQATYNGSSYTWGFAANQYDYVGNTAGNTTIVSQTNGAVVDLFGWVGASSSFTGDAQYGVSTSTTASDYGNVASEALKSDWGNTIDNSGTWRTLSKDEWTYMFNTRTASAVNGTANARYAKATVNSKAGVILLPDTYAHPEGVTLLTSINTTGAAYTDNTYDLTNWAKIESAGAVFLPAAGCRDGSNVSYFGDFGRYWSSTADDECCAYYVIFNSDNVYPDFNDYRTYGYSVRLITESK